MNSNVASDGTLNSREAISSLLFRVCWAVIHQNVFWWISHYYVLLFGGVHYAMKVGVQLFDADNHVRFAAVVCLEKMRLAGLDVLENPPRCARSPGVFLGIFIESKVFLGICIESIVF